MEGTAYEGSAGRLTLLMPRVIPPQKLTRIGRATRRPLSKHLNNSIRLREFENGRQTGRARNPARLIPAGGRVTRECGPASARGPRRGAGL
ncbi:hypothetical protein EVAR_53227_1 [Eumeta japonica]|uniref:Uncharacterized protein n=1 Tax=Eumeta variegata TaxID=151549 RepID=A0A4C1XEA5_EUMVA|nr:hypothetical protein EVAR_53227_1 [Eumeta japonica]